MANYPKNLILFLYNNNIIQEYLNEENFEYQFNVLCSEAKINKQQKQIIESRFRDEKTLQAIGDEIGMSRQGVFNSQNCALIKLQQTLLNNINVAIYSRSTIEDLSISGRAAKKLHDIGIYTVDEFISKKPSFFLNLKGVGIGIFQEIIFAYYQAKFSVISSEGIKENLKIICNRFKIKAKELEPVLIELVNEEEERYKF